MPRLCTFLFLINNITFNYLQYLLSVCMGCSSGPLKAVRAPSNQYLCFLLFLFLFFLMSNTLVPLPVNTRSPFLPAMVPFPVNTRSPFPSWRMQYVRGLVFFTESDRCLALELEVRPPAAAARPAGPTASSSGSALQYAGPPVSEHGCFVGVPSWSSSSSMVSASCWRPLNAIEPTNGQHINSAVCQGSHHRTSMTDACYASLGSMS